MKRRDLEPSLRRGDGDFFVTAAGTTSGMRLFGRVYEDDAFWLVEIPLLEAMTQGHTRDEALTMAKDLVESLANCPGFSVTIHCGGGGGGGGGDVFEVGSTDVRGMVALLLRRQRERSGLTLAEAAERLGARSRNAYARYEQGVSVPTVEKLSQLIEAVSPEGDFVLHRSGAAPAFRSGAG